MSIDGAIVKLGAGPIALFFAAAMLACWILGFRRGRHFSSEMADDPGTKFIDGSMALLGLLLAFTFSMSLGRHDYRRLAVVAESNAIGDFYTCASMLKEPYRTSLQDVIREYAQGELASPQFMPESDDQAEVRFPFRAYARMTEIARDAVAAGTPIAVSLTNTLNDVTSTAASRRAAYQESLPWSIVWLLFLSSIVPSYSVGERQGTSNKRHPAWSISFIVLVALVVFVTLDLNQPHGGFIRVNRNSLEQVLQSMART
jgi:hypothetical protein